MGIMKISASLAPWDGRPCPAWMELFWRVV